MAIVGSKGSFFNSEGVEDEDRAAAAARLAANKACKAAAAAGDVVVGVAVDRAAVVDWGGDEGDDEVGGGVDFNEVGVDNDREPAAAPGGCGGPCKPGKNGDPRPGNNPRPGEVKRGL